MKCPSCRHLENKVIDSRLGRDGDIIRRRRECEKCGRRFTTYERLEEAMPLIVKKDDSREPYSRDKIRDGLDKACEKRPVSAEARDQVVGRIERLLQEAGEKEVSSTKIGEAMMRELYALDKVAYVRFASVYRSFRDIDEFLHELEDLVKTKARRGGRAAPRKGRTRAAKAGSTKTRGSG